MRAGSQLFLHGFGQRYDLPIALPVYLFAAAAVVVLSFLMVVLFAGERQGQRAVSYPRRELRFLRGLPRLRAVRIASGTIGVLLLLAVVVCGWFGSPRAERNPAEYITWIYFWAGLVMFNGLVGPLWDALNPFRALDSALSAVLQRPSPTGVGPGPLSRAGVWPAVVLYFAFACVELASGYANRPWLVATLAFVYTVFTLVGMRRFGRDAWLERFEFFTVLFSVIRRFAPLQVEGDRVYVRPWGVGLLEPWPAGWDRVVFPLLMLSTLAFDGILATPLWQDLSVALGPYWQPFGQLGFFALRTLGLVDLTLLFLAVFVAVMRLVLRLGAGHAEAMSTMTAFALTLVPIAFVYNAAHNYGYLVVQSQALVPLLADPLGRGWNLLPTKGFQPSLLLANAALVWYVQVVLIVLGHVIAVYLAHLRASERFRSAQRALLSQYPLLLLMVLYTMTSLWILAQPVTRQG